MAMAAAIFGNVARADEPAPPKVGDEAKDIELQRIDGERLKLSELTAKGPLALVVLRGYPGYQCPICSRQVQELAAKAAKFRDANAQVVLVYPGPAKDLKKYAEEFVGGKSLPEGFHFALDPDYAFTNAYNLRWNAPRETAYPSTFVIGRGQKIQYAKISKSHGGRAPIGEVLEALAK
jgi:peroxiredoxin